MYPVIDKETGVRVNLADLYTNRNPAADPQSPYLLRMPLRTMGELYSVYDESEQIQLLVPYKKGKEYIAELVSIFSRPLTGSDIFRINNLLDKLKGYTVSVFPWQQEKLDELGDILYYGDGKIAVLKEEAYDSECGLIIRDSNTEDYII